MTLLMNRIDPALFQRCFNGWVAALWPDRHEFIAIDGKAAGIISVDDPIKASTAEAIRWLARTEQLFAEAGYSVQGEWLNLEPFVNLAYVNFENNGIAESGGAARACPGHR